MTFRDVRAIRSADGSRAYLGAGDQNLRGRLGRANEPDSGRRRLRAARAPDGAVARHRPGRRRRLVRAGEKSRLFSSDNPLPLRQCCRPPLAVGSRTAFALNPRRRGMRQRMRAAFYRATQAPLSHTPTFARLPRPLPAHIPSSDCNEPSRLPAIADITASSCPKASVPACAYHARQTSTLASYSSATTAAPLRSGTPWRDALTGSDMSRKAARP